MTIHEKLNAARLRFLRQEVKKSGQNKFAGYSYFELSDILPVVNQAAHDLKFTCVVRFGKEEATLDFIDLEKPEEKITFCTPMSTADLRGCHPVQSLGAVETYLRRYLYIAAFEICESDALDAMQGKAAESGQSPPDTKPPKQAGAPPAKKSAAQRMKEILEESRYPNGEAVFGEEDKTIWQARWKSIKEHALPALEKELAAKMRAQAMAQANGGRT